MKKHFKNTYHPYLLLTACICFLILGLSIIFVGALSHINPHINFTNLFSKEPMMNLIYTILPSFE